MNFNYTGSLFRINRKYTLKWKKLLIFNTVELYLVQIINIRCSGWLPNKEIQYSLFTFITVYSVLFTL